MFIDTRAAQRYSSNPIFTVEYYQKCFFIQCLGLENRCFLTYFFFLVYSGKEKIICSEHCRLINKDADQFLVNFLQKRAIAAALITTPIPGSVKLASILAPRTRVRLVFVEIVY